MITYELLAKLRLENASLLTRMDQLRQRAEVEGTSALSHEVSMLRSELHDYVCLVDALVDALVPDRPASHRV
ncbi:MAG TPA: hypothetical protein VG963_05330 [Polyangiaceae bacterium]|nr:hypothetical protein [Polyangiaceae bacterium]